MVKFLDNPLRSENLVFKNYGEIHKALNSLTESVKMSESLRPKILRPKYCRPKILAVNVCERRQNF